MALVLRGAGAPREHLRLLKEHPSLDVRGDDDLGGRVVLRAVREPDVLGHVVRPEAAGQVPAAACGEVAQQRGLTHAVAPDEGVAPARGERERGIVHEVPATARVWEVEGPHPDGGGEVEALRAHRRDRVLGGRVQLGVQLRGLGPGPLGPLYALRLRLPLIPIRLGGRRARPGARLQRLLWDVAAHALRPAAVEAPPGIHVHLHHAPHVNRLLQLPGAAGPRRPRRGGPAAAPPGEGAVEPGGER
mmetsp:Transcript_46800/g.133952  ORF Transcript_46800/g.133952 Transcript_46800/m.133952 type:complete len:246 (+) Transcript_46800:1647-2384(+)